MRWYDREKRVQANIVIVADAASHIRSRECLNKLILECMDKVQKYVYTKSYQNSG